MARGEERRKRQQAELARLERERQRQLKKQQREEKEAAAGSGKRPAKTVSAMRKAVRKNARLEADFKEAFETRVGWGEVAVKVVLMSEDWSIERHPATGAIVRRTFEVDIAGKKSDGSIMVYAFLMQQQSLGPNSWGKSSRSSHTALGYIKPSDL